jgi:hypothetical protein
MAKAALAGNAERDQQQQEEEELRLAADLIQAGPAPEINRWDMVKRGTGD